MPVAGSAPAAFRVGAELLAKGPCPAGVDSQGGYIWRRLWFSQAENVLKNPDPPKYGRGLNPVGCAGQDGALGQEPAAAAVFQRNLFEVVLVDLVETVMFREVVVDEGVVGAEELAHRAVLLQHVLEDHEGLGGEGVLKGVIVEGLELLLIRRQQRDVLEVQPLAQEVVDEEVGLLVFEHPLDLPGKGIFIGELVGGGELEEGLVGHRVPEVVAQAGGERVAVEFAGVFIEVEEARRAENRGVGAGSGRIVSEADVGCDLGIGHRAPEGLLGEFFELFASGGLLVVVGVLDGIFSGLDHVADQEVTHDLGAADVVEAFVEELFREGVDEQLAGLAAEQLVHSVGVLGSAEAPEGAFSLGADGLGCLG